MKKILIYNSGGGLGDSIQIIPLLLSIKNHFKEAEILYLGAHTNHFEGKLKDYNYFNNRAKTWTTLFRSGEHLIFPKDENGKWLHDDPLSMSGWVESNSWQGSWQGGARARTSW